MIRSLLFLIVIFCFAPAIAQTPKDASIPIQLSIGLNPPAVLLNWTNPAPSDLILRRRVKGQAGNTWVELVNAPQTLLNGYYDSDVLSTEVYEYEIEEKTGNVTALGAGFASFYTPPVDTRGKILVFIDSLSADQLGADLIQFKNDLRGEGWQPVPFKTGNFTTVQWVKNQILAAFNADPENVKAVLLMGNVPVPYSGSIAWDNKPDHLGAWPCDAYYGDMNGVWTDNAVNLPNTARLANRNVPGDGKFDANILPSAIELPVGRLDFRRLSPVTFGATPVELLRKYLLKNHRWRTGQYKVPRRALVDDHLGWSGGEAFASDGFRNAYPLVGDNQITEADLLATTHTQRYLLGYGAGSSGTYTSAAGIGTAANFAADSVQVVFANLFGDYFGDWDYESDPLLPAVLASKGGVLACGWSGRPHWFMQGLAAGETIGYCLRETQNAQFNEGYGSEASESSAAIALLGDPTLRALVVAPPSNLSAVSNCTKVNLKWTASPEPGIQGYLVYRALDQSGPYLRITPNPISETFYDDFSALADTLYYAVRAVKLETSPGGGLFYNSSTSEIRSVIYVPGTGPTVLGLGGFLNCNAPTLILGAHFEPPTCTYDWYKPDGSPNNGYVASEAGVYTVIATAPNGCTAVAYATVYIDTLLPAINLPNTVLLNCANPAFTYTLPVSGPEIEYKFNGVVTPAGTTLNFTGTSVLEVYSANNGCSHTYAVQVSQDFASPGASATTDGNILDCSHGSVQLFGNSLAQGAQYAWSGNGEISFLQNPIVSAPGLYCLTVTALNGCTSTACVAVSQQSGGGLVTAQIVVVEGNICENTSLIGVETAVTAGVAPFQYAWSNGSTEESTSLPFGFTGTASVTVTDHNGCIGEAQITVYPPLGILAQVQQESSVGAADGSIELLVWGGQPPYQFEWSNGATTQDITGLSGGTYTVLLTDQSGCMTVLSITITTIVGTPELDNHPWVQLQPNPAQDQFVVIFLQPIGAATTLRLLDVAGNLLATQTGPDTHFIFNTAALPNGIYWLWVETGAARKALRVAVLH